MTDIDQFADRITAALAEPRAIAPLSQDGLTLDLAYSVADAVRSRQGRTKMGRKVGFTNRGIWPVYGIDRPMWGEVSAESLIPAGTPVDLSGLIEPRIEPEIVLGLGRAPEPGMDIAALKTCIDWVAPGFEIVHSIYSGWSFAVEDAIAAQGLHGCLVMGDRLDATSDRLDRLTEIPVTLSCDGTPAESGTGANALDGPLSVLAHLVGLLDDNHALEAGELVTTGTLTDALPVTGGQAWSAEYGGVMGTNLSVRFA